MKNLWISLKITLAMCIVLGVGYVLVLRGISAVAGPNGGEADVVTLDGQVMNPGGSMTGGSSAKSAGVLSRANELKRLEQEQKTLSDAQTARQKSLQDAQSQLAETEYELKNIGAELREAEDEVLRRTHDTVTSYRNSKNYGDNWISAGYALWFLRESRYLNHARSLLGTSCAVSGTGFLFSRAVLEETGPWPFHLLTEDIQFSVHEILQGRKVAFAPDAVLYDEQPTTFRQSWRQRMRWSQGYLQVFRDYGARLLRSTFRGSFSCFDMSMAIMPAFVLSTVSILVNLTLGVVGALAGDNLLVAFESVGQMLLNMYLTLLVLGGITTITEWKNIRTSPVKKIVYMFTFPLFMFTYIPISLAAFFCKPQWKPIEHRVSAAHLRSRDRQELLPF